MGQTSCQRPSVGRCAPAARRGGDGGGAALVALHGRALGPRRRRRAATSSGGSCARGASTRLALSRGIASAARACLVGLTRDPLPTRTVRRGYGGPGDAAWDLRQPSVRVPRAHRSHRRPRRPAAAATCGASERRESPARRSSAPMRCARSMREHRIK